MALAFIEHPFFKQKQLLIIEKSSKSVNDKTWCFWEIGTSKWDEIAKKTWKKGCFISPEEHIDLDLGQYRYKQIAASDFYTYAFQKINTSANITTIQAEVFSVKSMDDQRVIETSLAKFYTPLVFDSRPPEKLIPENSPYLLQHFKGCFVRTNKPVFDPTRFIMMDYRVTDQQQTNFIYVLPKNKHEALIEHTYFNTSLVNENNYDAEIAQYLSVQFQLTDDDYTIVDTERGIIPMNTFPYHKTSEKGYLPIGTRGGWVKPSTGYSFKNAERMAQKVVYNLANGKEPGDKLIHARFRWYDSVFIKVLYYYNNKGPKVFAKFYKSNATPMLFKF
ncbi:MAG: lycopene cyclase family protein, partial [Flavobacteriaceae bacterium]|nr:lycopene cyclase family protein [Flavobacteriaceae bacterium]